jgi:hypothetical protein
MRLRLVLLVLALLAAIPANAAQKKALFDNTHAETAGNADWQLDTDQPVPVPTQANVTWATPRTYWLGAVSSWGIDLVKRGYSVATLTTAYGITYGNAGNAYDLSNFDVFIVPEPNTRFTAAESTAIFNYVWNGGGLVAVADHANSDRNNDGVDSPKIWGRLDRQHLWGAHFDSTGEADNYFTQDSGNIDAALDNPVIRGVNGFADSLSFHGGTSLTLFPGTNPTVRGDVWMNARSHGNSGVMAAHSTYGQGRIFFVGDSSPVDDGSAAPGNSSIYDGWGEVSGRDSLLIMNGTMWATRVAADVTVPSVTVMSPDGGESWVEGSLHTVTWTASDASGIDSVNVDYSLNGSGGPWLPIQHGAVNSGSIDWVVPATMSDSASVRVIALDPSRNQGNDQSDGLFQIVQDVSGIPGDAPVGFFLAQPAPNPSRGPVVLAFSLSNAGSVRIEIVDVAGRRVWSEDRDGLPAGDHSLAWAGRYASGRPAASGIYFVHLTAEGHQRSVRLIRLP